MKQHYAAHPRKWREFSYVYPVISRRSGGLSIGVNLNIDKVCNWDCVYCQVDRSVPPPRMDVDLDALMSELDWLVGYAASGAIWDDVQFADVPADLRRINDIAFSGDGEPTTYPRFDEACEQAAAIKARHHLDAVKLIVLSNMTMAHRPAVQRGFAVLDQNNGEIWAKLEAGTQAYYELVDRSAVKLDRIVSNILDAGRLRPIVIQSMFMKLRGEPIPDAEFNTYLDRLAHLVAHGCQIKLVQLYTIARQTAESYATPLSDAQLDALAARLHARLPQLPAQTFYGVE
ncbi:MAG: radical SAM protein [Planctomycetes bacterium]|nr:radical SAM protein [Planctomycetota bacterium]